MESTNMDFNVSKAKDLMEVYKKNKSWAKIKFLRELISFNDNFQSRSILGAKLVLESGYSNKTINSVISDLGYTVTYISKKRNYDSFGYFKNETSIISFNN